MNSNWHKLSTCQMQSQSVQTNRFTLPKVVDILACFNFLIITGAINSNRHQALFTIRIHFQLYKRTAALADHELINKS